MVKSKYYLLIVSLFVLSSLLATPRLHAEKHQSQCKPQCHSHDEENCKSKPKLFKHNIQLQLADSLGFPIPGTEFWVTIEVIKNGPLVTLQLPLINFQTLAAPSPDNPIGAGLVPGGYLYTSDGFLPEKLRPSDLVPRSIVAASDNGLSSVFSYTQDPATLPQPPVGYIVQVTHAGALQIQCAGTFGNIIPVGPQILMPCSITYEVKCEQRLDKNITISTGATNITQFTGQAASDGIRNSHVNDAFNGVVAFCWADNSMIIDQTNGTMNAMVAIGKVGKEGKLKVGKPVQLTNLPANMIIRDSSVAINRTNPNNIVVSWGKIDNTASPYIALPYRAVSFDGGKTWPYNGPMNVVPTGNPSLFSDCLGVSSDKFGNIWYSATNGYDNLGNFIGQPYFAVSTDGGVTFTLAYTAPALDPAVGYTDYPQYCFGGDGSGNYGLWLQTTTYLNNGDAYPNIGFIEIPGPLTPADLPLTGNFVAFPGFNNSIIEGDLTAASDGRVWFQGYPNCYDASTYIQPQSIAFKSPGAIDENWSGPWNYLTSNNMSAIYFGLIPPPVAISYPLVGYFANNTSGIVYDEKRQAVYAMVSIPSPDYSQNFQLPFIISRDNGMTWSDPILINSTDFANRGYSSMALDEVTGNLVFGWYDGRNDRTYQTIEYFGAVLPAKELDELVKAIPLSNPNFQVPSAS